MVQIDETVGVKVRQGKRRHFKYKGKFEYSGNGWFNYPMEGMNPLRFVYEEVFCVESVNKRANGYDLALRKENSTEETSWNMRHPKDARELLDAVSASEPEELIGKSLKIYIKENIVVGIAV